MNCERVIFKLHIVFLLHPETQKNTKLLFIYLMLSSTCLQLHKAISQSTLRSRARNRRRYVTISFHFTVIEVRPLKKTRLRCLASVTDIPISTDQDQRNDSCAF